MNNEQLQDWLANLHKLFFNDGGRNQRDQAFLSTGPDAQKWSQILRKLAPQTNILLNYFICNFDDPRRSEPLITQILSLYYKIGIARCFVLQLVPTFIHAYLKALTKRWNASAKMLEMFFLAIYNEEILAAGPGTPSMAKRSDEVCLPSLRPIPHKTVTNSASTSSGQNTLKQGGYGNIAQCNSSVQICILPEETTESKKQPLIKPIGSSARLDGQTSQKFISATTPTTSTGISSYGACSSTTGGLFQKGRSKSTVQIGPFPAIERIVAENRFLVLTRLTRTVNQILSNMAPEVVCRALCHSLLYICRSGFSFQESDFRQRILKEYASSEILADFSRKSRIRGIPSHFFIESINGLNFALLNGYADIALRALDALHQRAQYELMADVQLSTNSLRYALSSDSLISQSLLGKKTEKQNDQQQQTKEILQNDNEKFNNNNRNIRINSFSSNKINQQNGQEETKF
ncbi:hypothetical protein ACQ4LE_003977 [Meloidogyne hapla]|uniref:Uncharacterized protein n=1 Tax=Meloidogyne hapla TaxID=6305 RepID=A0A1I8AYQ3_MELHA